MDGKRFDKCFEIRSRKVTIKMPQFQNINPVVPAKDVAEAIDFYTNKLGFKLVFADSEKNPTYAGVKRDGVELHLQCHDAKGFDSVGKLALRFVIEDVDTLFEEYKDFDLSGIDEKPIETAWGTYEFSFYDPNNNALFFYRDL